MEIKAKVRGCDVITGEVRINWTHLDEPSKFSTESKAYYRCDVLISKDDQETINALNEATSNAIQEANIDPKEAQLETFFKDGDLKMIEINGSTSPDPVYANCFYFSTKREASSGRPEVLKLVDGKPVPAEYGDIYDGVKAIVSLWIFCYKHENKVGVSQRLNGVMKTNEGERLGGGSAFF